jgi:hypothetical protein
MEVLLLFFISTYGSVSMRPLLAYRGGA